MIPARSMRRARPIAPVVAEGNGQACRYPRYFTSKPAAAVSTKSSKAKRLAWRRGVARGRGRRIGREQHRLKSKRLADAVDSQDPAGHYALPSSASSLPCQHERCGSSLLVAKPVMASTSKLCLGQPAAIPVAVRGTGRTSARLGRCLSHRLFSQAPTGHFPLGSSFLRGTGSSGGNCLLVEKVGRFPTQLGPVDANSPLVKARKAGRAHIPDQPGFPKRLLQHLLAANISTEFIIIHYFFIITASKLACRTQPAAVSAFCLVLLRQPRRLAPDVRAYFMERLSAFLGCVNAWPGRGALLTGRPGLFCVSPVPRQGSASRQPTSRVGQGTWSEQVCKCVKFSCCNSFFLAPLRAIIYA